MTKCSVVFFGTPSFARDILAFLLENKVRVVAVVTKVDTPKGRSKKPLPSEVKEYVQSNYPQLPVFQPKKASDPAFIQAIRNYQPDLFVVVSYGHIMNQELLDAPRIMPINVHPSLLPKYRGAAPIRRALWNGDKKTGVSIMEMVREMDAGDVLLQEEVSLPLDMNHDALEEILCEKSCHMLLDVINRIDNGESISKVRQKPEEVSFAQKIEGGDLELDFSKTALEVHNQIRALAEKPAAYAYIEVKGDKKKLKILSTELTDFPSKGIGSTLCYSRKEGWVVSCKDFGLKINKVQLEGKKVVSAKDFLNGIPESPHFIIE